MRIRQAREERGVTLMSVAEKAGISKGYLSAIETGQANPTLNVLTDIAYAIGVTIGELFSEQKEKTTMGFKMTICVDFDGVIHSYTSGWKGATVILDPPVDGAFEWLRDLLLYGDQDFNTFEVCIYSSRSKESEAVEAMRQWFSDHGLSDSLLEMLSFPVQKPAAFLTIDDRAWCFTGTFPTVDEIKDFKPWNKQ